ncbi:MAG: hypothetical protein GXO60_03085 [Epsilonproteobacteria bacterium]|nr:hypothetical protein [Campylobacterota bacterium]
MNRIFKSISILSSSLLFVGCVSTQSPRPTLHTPTTQPHSTTTTQLSEYGMPPVNYRTTIKNYFATKIKRPEMASFVFSKPQRAYKRKGLAYGGDIVWKGWLVDVSIATKSRSGRLQTPRPYMVLFNGSTIVEDILGSHHQLITRVGQ